MPDPIPSLKAVDVIRALEKCGLQISRQRGGHVMLMNAGLSRPVVVSMHGREISPGTIRSMLRQAQVGVDDFLANL